MPVTGLPMVLENMVMAIMKTHSLKTWNLFHEENGNITFRLKFDHIEESLGQLYSAIPRTGNHETISFRKKNSKQISRDKARSRKRRRVRQSTSSIETNRRELLFTDNEMDISHTSSPIGDRIEVNESVIDSPCLSVLDPPQILEEPSELDNSISSPVKDVKVDVHLPPVPDYSDEDKHVDKVESTEEDSEDDYIDCSSDSSSGGELVNQNMWAKITKKLDEIEEKMPKKKDFEDFQFDFQSDT